MAPKTIKASKRKNLDEGDEVETDDRQDKNQHPSKRTFFRVIPPLSKLGQWLKNGDTDPISQVIDDFEVKNGEIVLDTGTRKSKDGSDLALIIRVDGVECFTWLRRLQVLDRPFGVMDSLPIIPPFTPFKSDATGAEVNAAYIKIHGRLFGTKNDMIKKMNEEEPENCDFLTVWKTKRALPASEINAKVDLEKRDIVLEDSPPSAKGNFYLVRDFEGTEAKINIKHLKKISDRAWNLRLEVKKKEPPKITNTTFSLVPPPKKTK